jgi:hypothetical protein
MYSIMPASCWVEIQNGWYDGEWAATAVSKHVAQLSLSALPCLGGGVGGKSKWFWGWVMGVTSELVTWFQVTLLRTSIYFSAECTDTIQVILRSLRSIVLLYGGRKGVQIYLGLCQGIKCIHFVLQAFSWAVLLYLLSLSAN